MNVISIQNLEKNVVQLEIEVDSQAFEEGMERAFRKNRNRFNIPGFRKGKAPRNIVERYYGEHILYEDAINDICPKAYEKAVEENNLEPVDKPEINVTQIGKGQNLIFTAKVVVKPEVELGQYKGIEIKKQEVNVTDEDVDKEIQSVVERNARIVTVEEDRGLKEGDIAVIDFEGFIDNEPFEGGKAENFQLILGSGQFIAGFEEQLTGKKAGEDTEVNVRFPEDYYNKELAGKEALFKVKVKSIKERQLPELDDEFVKDVSEFDTLDEYREDMRKKLVKREEERIRRETENAVLEKVVENSRIDLPQVMIDHQVDHLITDYAVMLRYQGLDLVKYLEATNTDIQEFRKRFEPEAEKDVRTRLVLEKISKVENIEATQEMVDEEIAKMAETYRRSREDLLKELNEENIRQIKMNLVMRKTIDFLVGAAKSGE